MERPKLGAGRCHVVHPRSIQPDILARQYRPDTVGTAAFQQTCAPPEEELPVDSYFDKGDGDAVGYEPVQLDAGDVGNDGDREVIQIPSQAWIA